jgi:hypothetical protein
LAKEKQKKKVCTFILFKLTTWINEFLLTCQKLSADLVKGKARANRAITELATAQQINRVLQMSLW